MRAADLQQVSYRQVARKGATLEEEASHYVSNSIRLGALVRRSPTAGFSPMLGAHLGILRERRRWSFGLAADIEQTDATNAFVEAIDLYRGAEASLPSRESNVSQRSRLLIHPTEPLDLQYRQSQRTEVWIENPTDHDADLSILAAPVAQYETFVTTMPSPAPFLAR